VIRAAPGLCLVQGHLEGRHAVFLIDSGASVSYVSDEWLALHNVPYASKSSPDVVRLADGTEVRSGGLLPKARIRMNRYRDGMNLHVTSLQGFDVVLGKDWLACVNPDIDWRKNLLRFSRNGKRHTLRGDASLAVHTKISPDNPLHPLLLSYAEWKRCEKRRLPMFLASIKDLDASEDGAKTVVDVSSLVNTFSDVFLQDSVPDLPPDRHVQHPIDLIPDAAPVSRPFSRMNPEQLHELQRTLEEFLAKGLIKPSTSPWGAPVIFVPKPDGSWRFCVDYRWLNRLTVKNVYPLPRIDDLLHQLHGAKVFSKIDLKSGYYQVKVKPDHTERTAFRTRYGSYEWTVMPMGLCNAPATFQRLMNDVFRPYLDKCVIVYLDDILIYSRTPEEHMQHLETVFKLLAQHKLFAHPKKSVFGVSSIDFLGHTVSDKGIHTDQRKIKALQEWPSPKSVTELRSFLGFANYYRRFVEKFAHKATPLLELTTRAIERSGKFPWTPEHEYALRTLIDALTSAPVLVAPDLEAQFTLRTDASRFAIGAVLSQPHGTIAWESRKLTSAERNYPVHEQELLSVVHALNTWKHLLQGARHPVKVITDNTPTTHVMTVKELTPRQARWAEFLAELVPLRLRVFPWYY